MNTKAVITGAFGYTGKYIARRLLAEGQEVLTLTGRPERAGTGDEFGGRVKALPFCFDDPARLRASLEGADTLYNTYWVRFDHGERTFARAVENTRALFRAASEAGVRRVVHVSITNPSLDSPLPYFRGKAQLELALRESGLSYSILRPTVIFGSEDILINNIAWLLRRFPLFTVPGSGAYRLQPVYVEDMARLAVQAAHGSQNELRDAVGPEIFSFDELLELVARTVGSRALRIHLAPELALALSSGVGALLGDVVLTRDEIAGLSAGLLVSSAAPTGTTRLADWLAANRDRVGQKYASEIRRHYGSGIQT